MKKTCAKIFVNAITMTRIIGAFLMPNVSTKFTIDKLVIYIIILLLTDTPDGLLARKFNVCTLFGALLDALADKLLALATLIVLAKIFPIMWIPIGLELIITLINVNFASKGSNIESSMLGKVKTWILGVCTVLGFITAFTNEFINLFNNSNKISNVLISLLRIISKYSNQIMFIIAMIATISSLFVAIGYFKKHSMEIKSIDAKKYKLKTGNALKEALFDENFYTNTIGKSIVIRLGKEVK